MPLRCAHLPPDRYRAGLAEEGFAGKVSRVVFLVFAGQNGSVTLAATFLLLTEGSLQYTHLGNRYEQAERPCPGHSRPAPLENPRAGTLTRLGHQSSFEIHLRRCAAG